MFQDDVERIERLAQQDVTPKPEEGINMKTVWTHAATALVAALLGVAGGARSVGEGQKPVRTVESATESAVKPLTYAEAQAKGKNDGLPVVVGVQAAAPKGSWVGCRIESWWPEAQRAGWSNTPQIVVFAKNGATLACLPATATADDVAKAIASPPAVPIQFGVTVQVPTLPRFYGIADPPCLGGNCRSGR